MSETIKRYSMGHAHGTTAIVPEEDSLGHWVKHSDHLAALSAKDAELAMANSTISGMLRNLGVSDPDPAMAEAYCTAADQTISILRDDAKRQDAELAEMREAARVLASVLHANVNMPDPDRQEAYDKWCKETYGPAASELAANPLAARLLAGAGKGEAPPASDARGEGEKHGE